MIKKMRVLLTGGAGYIGSFITRFLDKNGYDILVLDNLENGSLESLSKNIKFIKGDIRKIDNIQKAVSVFRPQAVIHLAAYAIVDESCRNPIKYYENNIIGSLNLLKIMVSQKIKYLIFSSSSAVYGNLKHTPVKEEEYVIPINPYGESKLVLERLLRWYSTSYGLRSIILRYFNVAGAMTDGSLGSRQRNDTHMISKAVSAFTKNCPVTIFGNDYQTNDGTCIRDYIHVEDIARANLLALKALNNGARSEVYNLGSGQGFSNKEIVKITSSIVGKKIEIRYAKRRLGDPPILISDSTKISNNLNFKIRNSDIKTIIKTELKWMLSRTKIKKD